MVQGSDVPVEVQTQKSLEADDRDKIIAASMHIGKKEILLTSLPHDCCDEVRTAQSFIVLLRVARRQF